MKRFALLLLVGLIAAPSLAQQSLNYKLTESVFNAGGHPANGAILASASFRVKLDAVGEGVVRPGLSSSSFRVDGGFVGAYPPPGEVLGLMLSADRQTLRWHPEKAVGTYALYRDLLTTLVGGEYGDCLQYNVAGETATDASTPPVNDGYFYIVTGRNRLREEGTKGKNSAGAERPNLNPCP